MDPVTTAALISGGTSLLGGLLGKSGAKNQNIANAKQAQLNRDFQERMSSTAHQRATADLRAAGLNPILSATKGGSSTPSGAQAQMQNELEPLANSARQTSQIAAQMKLVQAQTAQTQAQTAKTSAETQILQPKAITTGVQEKIYQAVLDKVANMLNLDGTSSPTTIVHPSPKKPNNPNWHTTPAKSSPTKQAAHYSTYTKKQVNWFKSNGYKYNKAKNRWIK